MSLHGGNAVLLGLPRPRVHNGCTLGIHTVWASSLSLAATKEVSSISFPEVTEMVQFSSFALAGLCIQPEVTGFPTSWVSPFGNPRIVTVVTTCPRLIAGYHVLHRFLVPSHPPYALIILTTTTFITVAREIGPQRRPTPHICVQTLIVAIHHTSRITDTSRIILRHALHVSRRIRRYIINVSRRK